MAANPPSSARSVLSVSSCASNRPRETPSARRTAISRRRRMARARRRFATFAHAISSTMTATPATQVATFANDDVLGPRSVRIEAATALGRATAHGVMRLLSSRCCSQLRRRALVKSAFAASTVTPGLRRAIIDIQPHVYVLYHGVFPLLNDCAPP